MHWYPLLVSLSKVAKEVTDPCIPQTAETLTDRWQANSSGASEMQCEEKVQHAHKMHRWTNASRSEHCQAHNG